MQNKEDLHELSNKLSLIDLAFHEIFREADPELQEKLTKVRAATEDAIKILRKMKLDSRSQS